MVFISSVDNVWWTLRGKFFVRQSLFVFIILSTESLKTNKIHNAYNCFHLGTCCKENILPYSLYIYNKRNISSVINIIWVQKYIISKKKIVLEHE